MNQEPGDPEADAAALAAVAEGDRSALRALYDRHAPWLVIRLSRRCADPEAVEEVVQDTFLAVWKRPRAYRGEGEVAAWIWGIAIRRLIDHLRRRSVREGLLARLPLSADFAVPAQRRPRALPSAEDQVLLGVQFGDLAGALNGLSPELRAVVQATVLDGLTTREAARLLGIPAGTVKTRMMRARIQLREALI